MANRKIVYTLGRGWTYIFDPNPQIAKILPIFLGDMLQKYGVHFSERKKNAYGNVGGRSGLPEIWGSFFWEKSACGNVVGRPGLPCQIPDFPCPKMANRIAIHEFLRDS